MVDARFITPMGQEHYIDRIGVTGREQASKPVACTDSKLLMAMFWRRSQFYEFQALQLIVLAAFGILQYTYLIFSLILLPHRGSILV